MRGNVDTRLKKLDDGEYDAIILAAAGLNRLGLSERIRQRLDIVSSVGQGAIGIECKEDNTDVLSLLKQLNDDMTARNVKLERYFSQKIQGTCDTPMGCHVRPDESDPSQFKLNCFLSKPDGSEYFEKEIIGKWEEGESLIDAIIEKVSD